MRARPYVDFSVVEPKHRAMDARLVNWARWCINRAGSGTSPMFRLYRSTDASQAYGAAVADPVDTIDAMRMQVSVTKLPPPHRLAISWAYIKRSSPRRAAQELGHSLEGLALLVRDGRQMLVNRGG